MKAELYWVDGPWSGRLAIAPRPRGGDWLEDEVRAWKREGIDIVVSSLTDEENAELGLDNESKLCRVNGLTHIPFPVPDRGVPASAPATTELVRCLWAELAAGKCVVIHCRQGVGRSALLAACLQVQAGVDAETAFASLGAARGCAVPETGEQRAWVLEYVRSFLATRAGGKRASVVVTEKR
jgi:protein-tyrosine phosphatase